ncbi:MAG: FG-GAP-like repeat-containing protein [Phycisphaerales bacterium]
MLRFSIDCDLFGSLRPALVVGIAAVLTVPSIVSAQCPITFAPFASLPIGGGAPLALGDFNHDGRTDFVGTSIGNSSIALRMANANFPGTYDQTVLIPLGLNPSALAVADFNHDGFDDIAAGYSPSGAGGAFLAVVLSNGNGTFQSAVTYPVPGAAGKFSIADLNHDGNPDIVQLSSQGVISVIYGNANGTFQPYSTQFAVPASTLWNSVALGDLNADGALDLIIPGYVQPSAAGFVGVALGVAPNSATFGNINTVSTGFFGAFAAAIGDFNHDGKLDVAVTNSVGSGRVQVYLNNGAGVLTASVTRSVGPGPTALAVADFNLDGNLDIVVANQGASSVSVYLGDGNGGLATLPTSFNVSSTPSSVFVTDLNGDGRPDIISGSGPAGDASILLGTVSVLTFTVQPLPAGTCTGGSAGFVLTIAGQVTAPTFRWQIEDGVGNWLNLTTDPVALPFGGTAFISGALVTGQSAGVRVNVRNRNGDFRVRCVASSSCTSGISAAVRLHIGCDSIANIVTIGGATTCDDELTADDVIAFLSGFFAQQPISDVVGLGGVPGSDGQWTADDVVAFLSAFFAGCP